MLSGQNHAIDLLQSSEDLRLRVPVAPLHSSTRGDVSLGDVSLGAAVLTVL